MYKTSESLDDASMEIGRIRAFTPGWLERESIFLHMTYKYLLSLLDAKLYDSYFEEIKTNLVPFLSPDVYGRPTTENSSFIASDVNPDESLIGQGFVSRLSGSTAEAISMWVKMFIGDHGFSYDGGDVLSFRFEPVLSSDFFDEQGQVSYTLFGNTKVVYLNESGKATFGQDRAKVIDIHLDGESINGNVIEGYEASKLRDGAYTIVTVYLK